MDYRRLRYYIRKKIRGYRKRSYGHFVHLRELPRLIAEMEDILAHR